MQLTILMIPLITCVFANTPPTYGQYGADEIPPLYPVESTSSPPAPLPANLPPSILAPPKVALSPTNSTDIPTSIVTDSRQYTPVPHYPIGNQTTVVCPTGTGSLSPPIRTGSSAHSYGYGKYGPSTTGNSYNPTGSSTKSSVPAVPSSSAASAGYSITWSLCVGAAVAVGGVLAML